MTVHDLLAEGDLTAALALQEGAVQAAPTDPAARRLLVDLLAFAGQLEDATDHLARIASDDPDWPEAERGLHRLFRSERLRTHDGREPTIFPDPPPKHAERRWKAVRALRKARPETATRADSASGLPMRFRRFDISMSSINGISGKPPAAANAARVTNIPWSPVTMPVRR